MGSKERKPESLELAAIPEGHLWTERLILDPFFFFFFFWAGMRKRVEVFLAISEG